MLNPMNTTQPDTVSPIAYPIRMEGGDLAPKGKGTFTIDMMPDGKVSLSVTLFGKGGTPGQLDLIVLDRLELVSTRSSLYKGKQWIKPAAAVLIGSIGFPGSAVLMWVWLDLPIYWYQFAPLFS